MHGCGDANNVTAPPPPTPLSPDAKLSSLIVSPGALEPEFSSEVLSYTVDVLTTVTSVTVTATPQNASASMTINGQASSSGQAQTITLGVAGSSTFIPIVVTAVNGSQNTYTVTVNRAAPGGNNNLRSLTVSPGTLVPAFLPNTTNYTVDVASSVASVTVTAQPQDAGATVSINGQTATSRSVSLGAAGSSTPVAIVVTALNGSPKTYLVTVNRTAPGGNNNLRSLSVSPGPLVPVFAASTTSYTVDVATSVTSVTVTAQPQDAGATVSINGQSTTSRPVALGAPGSSTPISLVVTAPNGTQKTYLVTVNRTALGGNNNLQGLTVTPGPLVPVFAASTTSYTVNVASSVTSVTVTATTQDTAASMTVNGQPTSSGQARTITLNAPGLSTLVTIEVDAQNGSQKTYFVTVNRTALGGNNNLQNLTVSPGSLVPAFTSSTTSYTVSVASSVASVTVTAQPQDAGATVSIDGQPTTSRSVSLGAAGSSTLLTIEVIAPNGSQQRYTVVVNRAAFVPSGNNNLSALVVSAEALVPTFDAATTSYTVTAPNTTTDTTVTATVADSTATMTINGSPAASGVESSSIPLAVGSNSIPIVVTAESGATKMYTVTITR